MSSKIKLAAVAALLLGSTTGFASAASRDCCLSPMFCNFKTYVGLDFKYWNVDEHNGYGDIFHENYYGASPFIGVRWCKMIGLELGYDWADKRSKDSISDGTVGIADYPIVAGNFIRTRTELAGPYLDLSGYYPVMRCLDLIATVGVSSLTASTNIYLDSGSGSINLIDTNAHGKASAVARIGGGLQYMVTPYVGVRSIVRWENTANVRVDLDDVEGARVQIKPFSNAVTATLGFFVSFT